ncbi:hypothetical protein [Streptomyces sparsogenes]|uniref:Uncharacterized protein n=1 Tax=Streptomyces sparsogenes DSM 40356 TaxID=1331668 RepID=A0A1R1SN58_9ACTN|nr:hypothetical protein [Streptomyces sparsogenes]OMI39662.1 hypothetical protein SPAR_09823 [Streptomyces sparsogenes DSM 40356]
MTALERSAGPGLGPGSGPGSGPDPIDEYVAALAAVLHGPARAKARMVTEARDALTDGAADFAPHLGPGDAARRAIDDFGSVEEVAPAFQRELTIAQARHTARAVALTVPFLMVCWYWTTAVGQGRQLPHHAQVLAAPLGGIAAAVALLAAASLAATGVLARRLPVPDRLPLMVAWTGTTAGTTLGISALTLTAVSALAGNWLISGLLGVLTVVSHARVAASARACRQCARLPVGRPAI